MANFFVILERQENEGKEVAGQKLGLATIKAAKVREAENKAKWSGSVELAKIVKFEGGTVGETRSAARSLFPGMATLPLVTVAEGEFKEAER